MAAEHTTPNQQPVKREKAVFGIISDSESYTVDEFRRRLNIGAKLWRKLQAQGLKVREAGRRRFVTGRDWHEFLLRN